MNYVDTCIFVSKCIAGVSVVELVVFVVLIAATDTQNPKHTRQRDTFAILGAWAAMRLLGSAGLVVFALLLEGAHRLLF